MPSPAQPDEPLSREEVIQATAILISARPGEARAFARERGWLTASGEPTEDGADMVRALRDQTGTRSVFRPF
jgi:hypothetical protein